jgi:c-di-AMP phosphodiesterase-like protein
MEESSKNDFVQMIRALWNEQKNREILYMEALKKDSMGSCRRILSQGHVSALLFQKEIKWIYDYFKCFLTDKDLGDTNHITSHKALKMLEDIEEKEQIATCLKRIEAGTLQLYKTLRTLVDKDSEARLMLDEHLVRISEFYEALSKMEVGTRKSISYTAAA